MSLMRWQDSFAIGIPLLDGDHQVIVSLLNQLHETREEGQTREVVGSVLNVLVEYTFNHFRREEELMSVAGYPELAGHRQRHRALADRVQNLKCQYDEGRHAAVDELLEFLKNWLVDHIIGEDTRFWPWVDRASLCLDAQSEFGGDLPREKG